MIYNTLKIPCVESVPQPTSSWFDREEEEGAYDDDDDDTISSPQETVLTSSSTRTRRSRTSTATTVSSGRCAMANANPVLLSSRLLM